MKIPKLFRSRPIVPPRPADPGFDPDAWRDPEYAIERIECNPLVYAMIMIILAVVVAWYLLVRLFGKVIRRDDRPQ